jgi:ribosome modulation factor
MNQYLVYFRTSRGGCGIEYKVAKAEFLAVFPDTEKIREKRGRHWFIVKLDDPPSDVVKRAEKLGYTEGILSREEFPYEGEELNYEWRGRWRIGWVRYKDRKVYYEEIYRQDEGKRLAASPHLRSFPLERNGRVVRLKGYRYRRGLSPLDAKFMVNIAQPESQDVILDPFAGLGGIVMECRQRGLRIIAGDRKLYLRFGLDELSDHNFIALDAECLPLRRGVIDRIITEPPFHPKFKGAMLRQLPEFLRVLKPGGRIVLFISDKMKDDIIAEAEVLGLKLKGEFRIIRQRSNVGWVLDLVDRRR